MFNRHHALKAISILSLALVADVASAHIGYGSNLAVAAAFTETGSTTSSSVSSNYGYTEGSQAGYLGNSHDTRARFFTLTETSRVSFTITGTTNASGASTLLPGFSLYKEANGNLPYASEHEGAGGNLQTGGVTNALYDTQVTSGSQMETYLQSHTGFASWTTWNRDGANVAIAAAQGVGVNELTGQNWGVFNAQDDFSAANNSGQVNFWDFKATDASDTNTVSYSDVLQAGIYAIFIGGNLTDGFDAFYQNAQDSQMGFIAGAAKTAYDAAKASRAFDINFQVAAVPVPGAVWLFGSAMAGLIGFGRRKAAIAA